MPISRTLIEAAREEMNSLDNIDPANFDAYWANVLGIEKRLMAEDPTLLWATYKFPVLTGINNPGGLRYVERIGYIKTIHFFSKKALIKGVLNSENITSHEYKLLNPEVLPFAEPGSNFYLDTIEQDTEFFEKELIASEYNLHAPVTKQVIYEEFFILFEPKNGKEIVFAKPVDNNKSIVLTTHFFSDTLGMREFIKSRTATDWNIICNHELS